jgi:hypothetical protein
MRILKKLTNPFVLVGEGFVVGAILFAASTPSLLEPARPPRVPPRSIRRLSPTLCADRLNAAPARL